jgi:hypothetical protein
MKGDGCGVTPLQVDALAGFLEMGFPFVCVCSHPDVTRECDQIISGAGRPVLHVRLPLVRPKGITIATDDVSLRLVEDEEFLNIINGSVPIEGLNYEALYAHSERVIGFLDRSGPPFSLAAKQIRENMGVASPTRRSPMRIDVPSRNHFVTDPTEAALLAIGAELEGTAQAPGGSDQEYANVIVAAASALLRRRQRALASSPALPFLVTPDLILAAPSLQAHWYEAKARRFSKGRSPAEKRAATFARFATDSLAKQRGYSHDTMTSALAKELTATPVGAEIMMYRRAEVRTFTAQLAVRASADATPALRLPMGVNNSRGVAKQLATAARLGPGPNRNRKINRFARRLSAELAAIIPDSLTELVATHAATIKIIADSRVEWTKVRGVPLMLRVDCSRIPATPGNSSFAMTVGGLEQIVPLQAFREVLVLRSFSERDPIRHVLEQTVRQFLHMAEAKLQIRVVDVKTLDDFATALDNYQGAIFVFDGHGGVGTSTTPGTIQLGGRAVDLFPLRGRVRMPPIAILSACDTHAYDGSHATPAHALLMAGVDTVVGTTLPVDARYSATFVARLLYRIDSYLPNIVAGPQGVARWSRIVPGLQRMNYVTEMLRAVDGKSGIHLSEDAHLRAGFVASAYINMGGVPPADDQQAESTLPAQQSRLYAQTLREERERVERLVKAEGASAPHYPDWLSAVFHRIAVDTGASQELLGTMVQEWAWITDALKYIELGNPERLLVVRDFGVQPTAA